MREIFNFSAGPSMLPEEVLTQVAADMSNYNGSGMSVMEMSHRSPVYEAINAEAEELLRELMNIPETYSVIFVQGGATMQFEAVPLNLLNKGRADYIVTGNFADRAYKEAVKFGDIAVAASSKDKNFTYIPTDLKFRDDIDYVHMTTNNTIFGTRFSAVPRSQAPIVADMSSNILGEVYDVNDFGVIYAGAQKNIGPAGVTVVIVRNDLIDKALPQCPTMLKWQTQIKEKSLFNTPPCFSTYVAMLVFRWLKKLGGVKTIQKINEMKARYLYEIIDNSKFYTNKVNPADRSFMNVPFTCPTPQLDEEFLSDASKSGLKTLKGHRLVGGMRASIYNAMPMEGVYRLGELMKKFEMDHR